MFARALIVLLIAINIGVAMWWVLRAEPPAPAAYAQPPGVPRLQLLSEAKPLAAAASASAPLPAATTPPSPQAPPAAPNRCFSLGPFATAEALRAADARVRPQVVRARTRAVATKASGYTVLMPPLASRELAQAAAEKIKAAGFDDLLVINEGGDANGIALGRYGSQESAQRRQAALQAAGFAAELRPIGAAASPAWLDIEARTDVDPARLRTDTGAAQSPALDCASLR